MADVLTPEQRRKNMRAIRRDSTGPELTLRRSLWKRRLRFFTTRGWKRLTGSALPGSPDLIFPSSRLVVFVDGCFWHGCPLHYVEPEHNREFWSMKLEKNRLRDACVGRQLEAQGWKVIRIWEHQITRQTIDQTVDEIARHIQERSGRCRKGTSGSTR